MRSRFLAGALCALVLACGGPARAETVVLDDSRSYTTPPDAQMQWLPLRGTDRPGGMEAWVRVNILIDTSPWVGRSGRIYMALSRDQASTIEAQWTTDGRLLAGQLRSGERTLVWAGLIQGDTLSDQMVVRLRSGPDWQGQNRRLNFSFELDLDRATTTP